MVVEIKSSCPRSQVNRYNLLSDVLAVPVIPMNQTIGALQHTLGIAQPVTEQRLYIDWPNSEQYQIWLKRDDLLHPIIAGNKWRKLKYALLAAKQQHIKQIISFGGGFSNHLHALGYACAKLDIQLMAIVRGDYSANLTPMLKDLIAWQTKLHYVDRKTYQLRDDPDYLSQLKATYPGAMIIPQGGSQHLALQGVKEVITELTTTYGHILAPVASGGTLAGLIRAVNPVTTQVTGIAVLKGQGYLESLVSDLLPAKRNSSHNWQINHDYHFGGYAKKTEQLGAFCTEFQTQTQIPVEPVYSGKLFYAARELIKQRTFTKGAKILLLHTGGLQGARTSPRF